MRIETVLVLERDEGEFDQPVYVVRNVPVAGEVSDSGEVTLDKGLDLFTREFGEAKEALWDAYLEQQQVALPYCLTGVAA